MLKLLKQNDCVLSPDKKKFCKSLKAAQLYLTMALMTLRGSPPLITLPNHPHILVFNYNNTEPSISARCQSYLRPRTATPR